ncbi:XRE family transcriptional regulator [Neptunomonas sp. XY-337]|uniref:helix-turn-helix domain-containing protein n=1 Tax=Neptunomonas sp. XY-337 TaxID=2561897 RepID=UPI0010AA5B53|nr:XRE family transcriptional regulator [Neptunomonas sp. XY-337]
MKHAATPNVGAAMKQRRKALGLNLAQLAERSNVSRSMLSEIERGNANPTFTTLWNITQALGVSIDQLAAQSQAEGPRIERQEAIATPRLLSQDQQCELVALNPVDMASDVEWYELIVQPGGELCSEAHIHGTREHLSVIAGQARVALDGGVYTDAQVGDTLRYPADIAHRIENRGQDILRAFLVVHKGRP